MFYLCESFVPLLCRKFVLLFYCTGLLEHIYVTLHNIIKALIQIFSTITIMCRQAEVCKFNEMQICIYLRQKYRAYLLCW